jgi:uncharacterized protein (DUF1800 family)
MTTSCWQPYRPTPDAPWDLKRVVHLHRRAGFAATWAELQRDLKDGPARSIERLLGGKSRAESVPPDFDARAQRLAATAVAAARPPEMGAAWMYRMLFGPDPLGERLALLWHNHFATSNEKLESCTVALRQVAIFREHGRGSFGELLRRVVRDPALMAYLDAPVNRKEHPNENLARELMELFTLGIGHYTEADVKEAARALSGWTFDRAWNPDNPLLGLTLDRVRFRFDPSLQDDGEKTILGQRGRWTGDDLLRLLLDAPATADRLAWRITSEFLGEGTASPEELRALADELRRSQLDIGKAVARVLRSERFFAESTIGRRVPGPIEWAISLVRRFLPLERPPSLIRLAGLCGQLGQSLFYPPNVGGWPGGRAWLAPLALVLRANLAVGVVSGRLAEPPPAQGPDILGLVRSARGEDKPETIIAHLSDLILGGPPDAGWLTRVQKACGPTDRREAFARRVAIAILSSPEAQLG